MRCFRRIKIAAGEYLYKKGEQSKTLWILLKGELDVPEDNLSYIGILIIIILIIILIIFFFLK